MTREQGVFYGGLGFIVLAGLIFRMVEQHPHPVAGTVAGVVVGTFGFAVAIAGARRGGAE